MLDFSRLCRIVPVVVAAACVAPESQVVQPPAAPAQPVVIAPVRDDAALAEEAKALLAQAETDVQRARSRRALWLKAWEDLIAARQAVAAKEHTAAIRHAKRASELAQLGLEQLAYPAVK
jgi:hypothetical protein